MDFIRIDSLLKLKLLYRNTVVAMARRKKSKPKRSPTTSENFTTIAGLNRDHIGYLCGFFHPEELSVLRLVCKYWSVTIKPVKVAIIDIMNHAAKHGYLNLLKYHTYYDKHVAGKK